MRERLEREPAELAISADSTGSISAARKSDGMWLPGLTELVINAGELSLTADREAVYIDTLSLDIGPIELPEALLGYPVALTDIHVGLVEPTKVVVAWDSDHAGRGAAEIDLVLTWSLAHHDTTSPLGSPDLPRVPVELSLSGEGEHVHAELRVSAPGELYKWANLLKLEDLSLDLTGDTL